MEYSWAVIIGERGREEERSWNSSMEPRDSREAEEEVGVCLEDMVSAARVSRECE